MGYRWRHRRGKRGRLPKPVRIGKVPYVDRFIPVPQRGDMPISLDFSELEVLRLVDLEGFTLIEAGKKMEVSRGTVWRILNEARRKVVRALTEARPILVHQA